MVDMQRRPEARWLVGFKERQDPTCLVASSLDRHLKPAQIDVPPLAGSKNDDFDYCVTHDDFSSSGPDSSVSLVPKISGARGSSLSHTTRRRVSLQVSDWKTGSNRVREVARSGFERTAASCGP